jgi:hypothetical protein
MRKVQMLLMRSPRDRENAAPPHTHERFQAEDSVQAELSPRENILSPISREEEDLLRSNAEEVSPENVVAKHSKWQRRKVQGRDGRAEIPHQR